MRAGIRGVRGWVIDHGWHNNRVLGRCCDGSIDVCPEVPAVEG
jgi:hypothetical protein